jgi:hypothetical protein
MKLVKNRTVAIKFVPLFIAVLCQSVCSQFSYPLDSGNVWEYWDAYPPPYVKMYTKTAIRDTTLSNGKTYTLLQRDDHLYPEYQRLDGTTVFQYNAFFEDERILFDFSKSVGDTVTVQYGNADSMITTVEHDGIYPVFGIPRRVIIYFERGLHVTMFVRYFVADGIGLIKMIVEAGEGIELQGAIIKNITYGMISSTPLGSDFLPQKYVLFTNYPNPFNPSTTISYNIPTRSSVSLTVFNSLGQCIATIKEGTHEAGTYVQIFDASTLPSGIYFYRLQATSFAGKTFTESKKMLYIR